MREQSWIEKKNDKHFIGLVYVSCFEELLFSRYENMCMLFSTYNNFLYNDFFVFVCIFDQSCRHIATRCLAGVKLKLQCYFIEMSVLFH